MGAHKSQRRTVVLGQQLAAARTREQQRRAEPHEPSPLGGAEYNQWRGEHRLSNPQPVGTDAHVANLCAAFASAAEVERLRIRASLSLDDLYTLLTFSRRASVFAIRDGPAQLFDGLVAIAMIDPARVDFRDALWALGLLQHAATILRSAGDQTHLFEHAATLADLGLATVIREAGTERIGPDNIHGWGYTDFESAGGPGLIRWGFRPYRPSRNLGSVGFAIATAIDGMGYQSDDPEVACEVPTVWIPADGRASAATVPGVAGAVHIRGSRRPVEPTPKLVFEAVLIWLAEVRTDYEAAALAASALKPTDGTFVRDGLSVGRLFGLIVQSSAMYGVPPSETPESIRRFRQPIEAALAEAQPA